MMMIDYIMLFIALVFMVLSILLIFKPSLFIKSQDTLGDEYLKNKIGSIVFGLQRGAILKWDHLRGYYEGFNRKSGLSVSRFFDMIRSHILSDIDHRADNIKVLPLLDNIKDEVLLLMEYDEVEGSESIVFKNLNDSLKSINDGEKIQLLKTISLVSG